MTHIYSLFKTQKANILKVVSAVLDRNDTTQKQGHFAKSNYQFYAYLLFQTAENSVFISKDLRPLYRICKSQFAFIPIY